MSAGAWRVRWILGSLVLLGIAIGCDLLARSLRDLPSVAEAAHDLALRTISTRPRNDHR